MGSALLILWLLLPSNADSGLSGKNIVSVNSPDLPGEVERPDLLEEVERPDLFVEVERSRNRQCSRSIDMRTKRLFVNATAPNGSQVYRVQGTVVGIWLAARLDSVTDNDTFIAQVNTTGVLPVSNQAAPPSAGSDPQGVMAEVQGWLNVNASPTSMNLVYVQQYFPLKWKFRVMSDVYIVAIVSATLCMATAVLFIED